MSIVEKPSTITVGVIDIKGDTLQRNRRLIHANIVGKISGVGI